SANGNGRSAANHTPDDDRSAEPAAHPDERQVLLASIYEGLISAADGDRAPLDECLRLLRAFRTLRGEDELPQQLALGFKLRRVAWDVLLNNGRGAKARRAQAGVTADQR